MATTTPQDTGQIIWSKDPDSTARFIPLDSDYVTGLIVLEGVAGTVVLGISELEAILRAARAQYPRRVLRRSASVQAPGERQDV